MHCFGQSASLLGHKWVYFGRHETFQVWEVLEHRSEVLEHRSEHAHRGVYRTPLRGVGTPGVLTAPGTGVSTC